MCVNQIKSFSSLKSLLLCCLQAMGTNLIDRVSATGGAGRAVDVLSACTYNTTALHIFLMHTPWSPVSNSVISRFMGLYDVAVDKHTMSHEASNMVRQ